MNINHHNLDATSISTNSFPNRKIHVLLVEDESRDHDNIMNLLRYFSYKVTSVKLVSTALSILSKGKVEFDLVMVNMNSQDSLGLIQLLHDATKMKLLVIFMSNVGDDETSMRALEEGAFLCIRKPLSMAIVASLWQLVLSEKAKETHPAFTNLIEYHNNSQKQKVELEKYNVLESNKNTIINLEKKVEKSENYRGTYKRKAWTEWTLELHHKFMAAARYLGQGKCYPKDILEIMNVPGLTRMQVASHLQKCRNANWLPPNERKSKAGAGIGETIPKKVKKSPRAKTIRFGLMPFWEDQDQYSESHQTIHEYHHAINHHAESSNSRYLDHGLHPFGPNNINNNQLIFFGDYQSHDHVDQLTNFLPNLINEDPFMDPNMVPVHDLPDFQIDFDQDWESFILDGEEQHHQVSAVAAANNQLFDEAFNSSMENEETEQGQTKEGR